MFEVVRDKKGQDISEQVCKEVLAYAEYHFAHEEEALQAVNYPDIEEQRSAHAWFKSEAEKLLTEINENFPDGAIKLYHFLREWLIDHILRYDKKYNSYLL
jgi:hemerythrin